MGFLRRLFGGGPESTPDKGLHLYVKCNHCGSGVHVRIDPNNDPSEDEGDTGNEGYTLIKEVMDDRCFRIMRAELHFDSRRSEISREIEGGVFITEHEWEELQAKRKPAG